jgi:DNA-directed RNA polymerase subunit N (RpoN/RPB10)
MGKRRISIGEIISVSHSFQDMDTINRVFSKMLGIDAFIADVAEHRVVIDEDIFSEGFVLKDDYPDFREQINELIHARHLIVHHEGMNRLGLKRFGRMWMSIVRFVTAADSFLGEKVKG